MSKNPAAVALGTLGGRAKSSKKTLASQENGKKGGYHTHKQKELATLTSNPQ